MYKITKMSIKQATFFTLALILVCTPIVSAKLTGEEFDIQVETDKPSYNPGDMMRIFVNITNYGEELTRTKELHARVIAKSWFGLTVHSEGKSYSRDFKANKTRFGYVQVPLPRYTPLGRYTIEIWTIYGDETSRRQIVEDTDVTSRLGVADAEVNLGIAFLLIVLAILGILLYIIFSLRKHKDRRFYAIPEKPVRPTHGPKVTDIRVERAIIIALVISIAISLIYVGSTKREKETFSVLYVKPGSYVNYLRDNTFTFTYGVECFEKYPTQYELVFLLDERIIEKEKFELCKLGSRSIRKIEEQKVVIIPSEEIEFPKKLRIVLKSWDREYENAIWIRGVEGEDQ